MSIHEYNPSSRLPRFRLLPAHTSNMALKNATSKTQAAPREASPPAVWSWFDKIYCISLTTRADRREEAKRQFASVGLGERVEFHLVEKHPANCEQGIYESHLQCMKKGVEARARRILIFEDDVVFARFSPAKLQNTADFLETTPDWKMLFLGCMVRYSRRTANPSVMRVGFRSLTHAYAVTREFALDILANHPYRTSPYDDFLRDLNSPDMYACYPSCAFQSNAASDNDVYLPLDRFRRMAGGLRNLQKADELYHRYKWPIILSHLLPAVALVAYWL